MSLKLSILFILILGISVPILSQSITFQATGAPCNGTPTFTPNGTVNGRDSWSNGGNVTVEWSGTQWEIINNGVTVLFSNTTDLEIPPCFGVGTWTTESACTGSTLVASAGDCGGIINYSAAGSGCNGSLDYLYTGITNGKYDMTATSPAWRIFWDGSQWVIEDPGGNDQFTNSTETSVRPPCLNVGTWVAEGGSTCDGSSITSASGDCSTLSLPVELMYFEGALVDDQVRLKWATASEIDNEGFEIEYSKDLDLWNKVGFLSGNGTTNDKMDYTYLHKPSAAQKAYYRLKQVDFDGKYEYSPSISILLNQEFDVIPIYPNPANTKINIENFNGDLSIYSMSGRKLFDQKITGDKESIDISFIAVGQYIIHLYEKSGSLKSAILSVR